MASQKAQLTVEDLCVKWRIVAFDHPKEEKSIIYRQNLTSEELLKIVERAMRNGCNLMSIRGFR